MLAHASMRRMMMGWLRRLFPKNDATAPRPFRHKDDCPDPAGATYTYERDGFYHSFTCNACGANYTMFD
jgi:hypothetical protein